MSNREYDTNINANVFSLSLNFYLSVDGKYDYTMDYMANVARAITRKYPAYHIHKKNEDKISVFLSDLITRKIEKLCDSRIENLHVTDIRELSDIIAEYKETATPAGRATEKTNDLPVNNPSFGNTGLELSMTMDTGASDIQPVAFNTSKTDPENEVRPGGKPEIRKRSVIRVSVYFDLVTEMRLYVYLIQELPELFGLKELDNLRVRLTWNQEGVRYRAIPVSTEVKVVENNSFTRWFVVFLCLISLSFIGILSLFYTIPMLYKQDFYFTRKDTVYQSITITDSRIEMENVSLPQMAKDTVVVVDKKRMKIKE